jgi:hypothetical protein
LNFVETFPFVSKRIMSKLLRLVVTTATSWLAADIASAQDRSGNVVGSEAVVKIDAARSAPRSAGRGAAEAAQQTTVGSSRAREWAKLRTRALLPPQTSGETKLAIIQFQVQYHNPAASEVNLIWGLNEFRLVPTNLPPGTFLTLNDSHMNTPMKLENGVFSMEFEVEENTRFDCAFTITRTATGDAVEIWRGKNSKGEYYTKVLTRDNADEVETLTDDAWSQRTSASEVSTDLYTKAIVPPRGDFANKPKIQFQVRRRDPAAGEIVLVWGLNNWAAAPHNLPPGTFLTYNGTHMNTPMKRQGDLFVFDYEVPENTRLDYAFITTRTAAGQDANIWAQDDTTGQPYTETLTIDGADEILDLGAVWPTRAYVLLAISVSVSVFFVGRLAWHVWRGPTGPT